jgi:cutinase
MKLFSVLFLLPLFSLVVAAPIFSRDINTFLAEVALLFPFSGIISDISGLLVAAENSLAFFFGIQTTQNGLSGSCGPVTVIFARGTTEPGNVGVLVGPPFFDALKSRIGAGNVVVQGVAYPASVEGFLVGGDSGSDQTMYAYLLMLGVWGMC